VICEFSQRQLLAPHVPKTSGFGGLGVGGVTGVIATLSSKNVVEGFGTSGGVGSEDLLARVAI
jgi:hypothetical protein